MKKTKSLAQRKTSASLKHLDAIFKVAGISMCLAAAADRGVRAAVSAPDELASGFAQPPDSAKPRVWWHWMNGNITKEGIKLDLEWMKRIGIGGFQNFDASLGTPQVVEKRLEFMTPEWQDAFSYTAQLADHLGLEMAIAGSPGWSESGGPWVMPADAMKKVVWSVVELPGGKRFSATLRRPPTTVGPFQNKPRSEFLNFNGPDLHKPTEFYADTAVMAYRLPSAEADFKPASGRLTASAGSPEATLLNDGDLTQSFRLAVAANQAPNWLQYRFPHARTIYGVTIGIEHVGLPVMFGGTPTLAELQSSDDGITFRRIASIPTERPGLTQDPGQSTVAFTPTTARFFRLALSIPKPAAATDGIDVSALGLPPPQPPTEFRVTEFALHGSAVVNHFEEKAAYAIAPDAYSDPTPAVPAAAVIGLRDVIDLTGRMTADGRLNWMPPPGRWAVLRLGYALTGAKNSPASPEATGLEVDKLDGAAVRSYLTEYLRRYQSASGGLLGGRGVGYVVTDSWEAGAQNWTPALFTEFKRRRGYDLHPWLPALTGRVIGSGAATDQFLWDFRATLGDLLVENHYETIAQVLHDHHLGLYSESHESGRAFIGDGMRVKRHATIPMGAMWTQSPGVDREQYGYNADIRESASVAHLYGQNLVAAESMTAGSGAWAWAPEYLKPTADKELAMGLNRFVIHTSVHQPLIDKPPGLGLGPFGQWFTRNETWAEQAAPWITYLARSSFLLQQGKFVADIAYFYGEDSNVTALFADKSADVPAGYNFDFINADALTTGLTTQGGSLVAPSGMRYRVLVLDPNARHMSFAVLRRLLQLVSDGAVVVGEKPLGSPSLSDDRAEYDSAVATLWGAAGGITRCGRGSTYAGMPLGDVLKSLDVAADFSFDKPRPDSQLLAVHRSLADGDVYFVDSRNAYAQNVDVSFRVSGKVPELWHADTGKMEQVSYRMVSGRTVVPLRLDAYEAVFVVFRRKSSNQFIELPKPQMTTLAAIDGPWRLRFAPDRGAPQVPQVTELQSWSESSNTGIRYFSGAAAYRTTFRAAKTWLAPGARVWLDLGKVFNIAEISLNGKNLGVQWKAPFRVDITDALKNGPNDLEVKVTNLWVNRLIGDQQPGVKQKYTFTTQAFYPAGAPLLPSGLLGPVQIQVASTVLK